MPEHEILISGAGPTGLMLAGELALAGIDVAIVEQRSTMEVAGRRAGGLHARSLEVLDQRGIVDRFLAEGQAYPNVGFHVALDISDFPTRHNYLLALRQQRIERLLADWVEELGVPVHRGTEVLGIVGDENGVEVATAQGKTMRAGWLVGCDGGRSTVRKSAGIDFPGCEASTSWLIAEVRMREQPALGFHETASGRHAMARLDDGETVGVVLAGQDPRATGVPSLHEFAVALKAAYGTDFGVHAPGFLSRFSDTARQAQDYRKGRILLAGDAAHIHSPMGGQGLNLGLQDAVNLGWKLARVARGMSPETLLDSYQAERHPVAARVLKNTIAQGVLRYPGDRIAVLGDFVSEMLSMEEPRKRFAAMMSGLDIRYGLGDGHPLLGRRMPDLDITIDGRPTRVFALLHDAQPVLLSFGKPVTVDAGAEGIKLVDATFGGECELPVIGRVDIPAAVLIRPDGHVAWIGDGSSDGLAEVFRVWFQDSLADIRTGADIKRPDWTAATPGP
ncbi:MAG TPA: FAD-dependent monooxygenase [Mesorhizobium sp.]|jgi:3-(3-hydroxy-phenyl)propionate hydroxylase|uniref:FAD-dependent monooxygenase n=1 Tax=Mesorhizobium sp. TaxID=1871066 RepID=UPI002DDD093F|nr:FAD-dependent monooxygenase [Mesorhizobium sp.]HEV2505266.1 FAD-dependent monooxygenase [Mesorhizobium sp.]